MTPRMRVGAIGFAAPGLPDWPAARAVLRGEAPYVPAPLPEFAPTVLPPNERRRATGSVRLAFRVAEQATAGAHCAREALAAVFASSSSDPHVLHRTCSALAGAQRVISPTDFHNSVHNAPAGYWSIATGARAPSTTLAAYDATFVAALQEAAGLVAEGWRVLLVCYDLPYPEPLHATRPLPAPVAVALRLEADGPGYPMSLARGEGPVTPCDDAQLEALRAGVPAARCLPLLQALAREVPATVLLPGPGGTLAVQLGA